MGYWSLSGSVSGYSSLRSSDVKTFRTKLMHQDSRKKLLPEERNIDVLMYKYYNIDFDNYNEKQKDEYLEKLDMMHMVNSLEFVKNSLAFVQLENYVLLGFLEKNDPTLLAGMHKRQAVSWQEMQLEQTNLQIDATSDGSAKSSRISSLKRSISIHTGSSQERSIKTSDYSINIKTKAEIAEKVITEMETTIAQIERNAARSMKQLRAQIEELRYRNEELIETESSFKLHFLNDDADIVFLDKATDKQLERKLRKFANNWFKNARALMSNIRLTITSVHDISQQLRNELMTKADLHGILTYVDYEKLLIRRNELLKALEEKTTNTSVLSFITANSSMAMVEEKQTMQNLERELRNLNNKTEEVSQDVIKLDKKMSIVNGNTRKSQSMLEKLREKQIDYAAPTIIDYIDQNEECIALDKETKMLQRKIIILNMKLTNLMRRVKKRDDT